MNHRILTTRFEIFLLKLYILSITKFMQLFHIFVFLVIIFLLYFPYHSPWLSRIDNSKTDCHVFLYLIIGFTILT